MSDTIKIGLPVVENNNPVFVDTIDITGHELEFILASRIRLRKLFGTQDLSSSIKALTGYEINTAIGGTAPKETPIILDQVFVAYSEVAVMINTLNPTDPGQQRILDGIRKRILKGIKTHIGDGNFATFSAE